MKTKTPLLPVAALLLSASPAFALNLVRNDTFMDDTDPWSVKVGSGAAATLDTDAGWGRVLIGNGGTSKSHVNLDQLLGQPLVNGVTYTIAFNARASAAKSIDVLLRNNAAIYHGSYGVSVGTTDTRVTLTYTHSQADVPDARLSFRIGGNTATLFIDNVVVARQGVASQLLTQNANGTWSFNTLSVGGKSWNAGAYDFSYSGYNYGERESFTGIPSATQTISAAQNTDITDALNTALANLPAGGGTVLIPAGTYLIGQGKIGKAVHVTTDNTVIKGAGMGVTTLKVAADYHADVPPAAASDAFNSGVIAFYKGTTSGGWFYGNAPSNAAKVSAPVALGTRSITVADPANTLANATHVVVRQIMWQSFTEAHAYNTSFNPKPNRWADYVNNVVSYTDPSYSFCYYRKILSRSGTTASLTLNLDVPIPHDLNPANADITVTSRAPSNFIVNSGMQDLTLTADSELDSSANPLGEDSIGATIMANGLLHGLFKNVDIDSFRSLGFNANYAVNTSFINCTTANALNTGGGGAGYGFYIKGQNLLYKDCNAINVRHGYTTAASQTSNIVVKNSTSLDYRFHTSITDGGESVDDTHLQYAHGILWDNHYAKRAGLLLINRGELSPRAYETCGWSIVWNYENEGVNIFDAHGKDIRHNLIGVTPTQFGMVIGAHAGSGAQGIRIRDGYSRRYGVNMGVEVTNTSLHVGPTANRVLYEHVRQPVAQSIYDIQLRQRSKILQ